MPKLKWISVQDKLPEEHQDVLVYFLGHENCKFFPEAKFITETSFYGGEFELEKTITHWCELPNLPNSK